MRVLIVPQPGTFKIVGGHVTQQLETVRALERAGATARIGSVEEALEGDYDVVHCFSDVRPLLRHGRPNGRLVVSPIYWPRSFVLGPHYQRPGYAHMVAKRIRHRAAFLRHPRAKYRRHRDFPAMLAALAAADVLVVNSTAEATLLRRDTRSLPPLPPLRIAYSGVAHEAFEGDAAEGRQLLGIGSEPFVLSVARVDPAKNALAIALALRGLPYKFVLVGAVLPGNEPYLDRVRKAAPDLIHVPHLEHHLVRHAHAAAAVHALPSWYETTGLSTLEALAAGTPVVVADGPCEREYFSDCAAFCRPASVKSVRRAILHALARPAGCERDVARRYSWDRTAQELLKAYVD
jgi:glycosyltransferase involved in cell wall biosynthesis